MKSSVGTYLYHYGSTLFTSLIFNGLCEIQKAVTLSIMKYIFSLTRLTLQVARRETKKSIIDIQYYYL